MGIRLMYLDPRLVPELLRQRTDAARYRYEIEGMPADTRVIDAGYVPRPDMGVFVLTIESDEWDDANDLDTVKPIMHVIDKTREE